MFSKYACPFEVKSADDAGNFEGYASVFNNIDLGEDLILPGAFVKVKTTRTGRLRLALYHNLTRLIGDAEFKQDGKVLTLPLYFDPTLPWYAAAKAADAKGMPLILRAKLPGGDTLYRYGYMSFDGDPTITANNPMGNTMTFTALTDSTLVEAA